MKDTRGAYDNVQRFIKRWFLKGGNIEGVYVPVSFAIVEAYQFDWSEEIVELGVLFKPLREIRAFYRASKWKNKIRSCMILKNTKFPIHYLKIKEYKNYVR